MAINPNEVVSMIMDSLSKGVEIEQLALIADELPIPEARELSQKIRAQEDLAKGVRALIEATSDNPDLQRKITFEFTLSGILNREPDGKPIKIFQ